MTYVAGKMQTHALWAFTGSLPAQLQPVFLQNKVTNAFTLMRPTIWPEKMLLRPSMETYRQELKADLVFVKAQTREAIQQEVI